MFLTSYSYRFSIFVKFTCKNNNVNTKLFNITCTSIPCKRFEMLFKVILNIIISFSFVKQYYRLFIITITGINDKKMNK